jgi:phosphoglycolate phosphatase
VGLRGTNLLVVTFDLLIFDLDGTLVDSLPDITRALNLALTEAGRAALSADVVRGLVGEGVIRLAEKALQVTVASAGETTAERVADRIRSIYEAEPCVLTRLYPGVADALTALRATGRHKLALLTNKPGVVTRPLLAALKIDVQFDAAIGDGDGHPRKPDPAAVHALCARFGTTAARTLMIGDGLPDMAVARAAGCAAAAALWGYTDRAALLATAPKFALEDVRDLLPIV